MPTYDYHCAANGRTLSARHRMNELIVTWGELCAHAAESLGDTPTDTPVSKVFTASNVVKSESLGSGCAPAENCGMGGCGAGMCQYQ